MKPQVHRAIADTSSLSGNHAQQKVPSHDPGIPPGLPDYLKDTYTWAYLDPDNVRLLDRDWVVSLILWGNPKRLHQAVFDELAPGQSVLQSTHVYGGFIPDLARFLGPEGELEVLDIAPVQVANCRRKLAGPPEDRATTRIHLGDARRPTGHAYDGVISFFLLHELPDPDKRAAVDALLQSVKPSGKAIFIDYHKPVWFHPLKPVMSLVFDTLEPFAKGLWRQPIRDFASNGTQFTWTTETLFGGLYQKTIAIRNQGAEIGTETSSI